MLKLAFAIYRKWAYDIFLNIRKYQRIRKDFRVTLLLTTPDKQFNNLTIETIKTYLIDPHNTNKMFTILKENKIDIIFFYGWSWIVQSPIIKDFICVCLHPSILPHYRGGSPIQHQLLNGEKTSGVTLFKMTEEIDAGSIYDQAPMSLLGDIHDIFKKITDLGTHLTKQLISDYLNNNLTFTPQKNIKNYPLYRRRTPKQSRIEIAKLKDMTYQQVYNLVRGLLDPYPNAFIASKTFKMNILKVEKYTSPFKNSYILSHNSVPNLKVMQIYKTRIFLKVKDGYARLIKYKIS